MLLCNWLAQLISDPAQAVLDLWHEHMYSFREIALHPRLYALQQERHVVEQIQPVGPSDEML